MLLWRRLPTIAILLYHARVPLIQSLNLGCSRAKPCPQETHNNDVYKLPTMIKRTVTDFGDFKSVGLKASCDETLSLCCSKRHVTQALGSAVLGAN